MTVDAHQHFWDPSRRTYPWMTKELDAIRLRPHPAFTVKGDDLEVELPLLDHLPHSSRIWGSST